MPEAEPLFYVLGANQVAEGPFSLHALRAQVAAGALTRDRRVCPVGGQAWVEAGQAPELSGMPWPVEKPKLGLRKAPTPAVDTARDAEVAAIDIEAILRANAARQRAIEVARQEAVASTPPPSASVAGLLAQEYAKVAPPIPTVRRSRWQVLLLYWGTALLAAALGFLGLQAFGLWNLFVLVFYLAGLITLLVFLFYAVVILRLY